MITERYSQEGHKFVIDGEMTVGNTITVKVEPLYGYKFASWSDGSTDNPRTIEITECGVSYIANFEEDTDLKYTVTIEYDINESLVTIN